MLVGLFAVGAVTRIFFNICLVQGHLRIHGAIPFMPRFEAFGAEYVTAFVSEAADPVHGRKSIGAITDV